MRKRKEKGMEEEGDRNKKGMKGRESKENL